MTVRTACLHGGLHAAPLIVLVGLVVAQDPLSPLLAVALQLLLPRPGHGKFNGNAIEAIATPNRSYCNALTISPYSPTLTNLNYFMSSKQAAIEAQADAFARFARKPKAARPLDPAEDPVTTLRKAAQKLRLEEIRRQLRKDQTNNREEAKMSNTEKMSNCSSNW